MAKAKQITVWLDSSPGQIGRVAKALGEAGVNITAFAAYSTGGESPLHMLVSSPAKAKKVVAGLGLRVSEEGVLRVTIADKPGMLGEIGARLGAAGVQVDYAYASLGEGSRKADVILGVDDLAGATRALRGL